MSKIKSLLLVIVLGGITQLWGATCPLSLSNSSIDPAPMTYLGDANGSFDITTGERIVPLDNGEGGINCTIEVILNKTELKEHDINLILGTVNTYFTVNYNLVNNKLTFTQKIDIPGNTEIHLTIPLDVTGQSDSNIALNGFDANITTNISMLNEYTYTNTAILISTDINATVNSTTENIAIDNITDNDTINGKSVSLGSDINITSITNTTPLVINQNTGSVTVPLNTETGVYTETYTICETYDVNNCSTSTIKVIVDALVLPDYKPVVTVYGGIVYGEGIHNFSFDTLVRNIISESEYDDGKPLQIIIPKNDALVLTFDTETTVFKGQDVDNNLWIFDDTDPFDYIITYIGNNMSTGRSRFSLQGTLSVEAGEVSKFFLETTIKSKTGGDSNIDNNSDRETLQKRL